MPCWIPPYNVDSSCASQIACSLTPEQEIGSRRHSQCVTIAGARVGCLHRACLIPSEPGACLLCEQAQLAAAVEKGSRTSGLHSRVAELEDRLQQVRTAEPAHLWHCLLSSHTCFASHAA